MDPGFTIVRLQTHLLPTQRVGGSSPVFRSKYDFLNSYRRGGIQLRADSSPNLHRSSLSDDEHTAAI